MGINLNKKYGLGESRHLEQKDIILLADHHKDIRLITAHHLSKRGFKNVVGVDSGMHVVEFLRNCPRHKKVGCVIAERDMPELSGIDLLSEISADPEMPRPPFVLTIASPSREETMLALEAGVDRVMVRPYSLNDVMHIINEAIRLFYNPKNPERVYNLAKKETGLENFSGARGIYRDLMDVNSNSARPAVGMALIDFKEENYDSALAYLSEAEMRNPNFVHIFSLRGKILMKMDQLGDSLTAYRKGIELSPLNPIRYKDVSEILLQDKRYNEIIEILTAAQARNVRFSTIDHYLSKAYFFLKQPDKAISHIKMALKIEPENISFLNQLAICHKQKEDYTESIKVYNKIIKIDPGNDAILFNKSICLHAKGETSKAIKILERVIERNPDYRNAKRKLKEYKGQLSAPKKSA